jgi:hypothetical protein
VYLLASQRREVRNNEDGAYFISNEMREGLKFLKARTKPNEVVFATVATSGLIPALSGNTVVWGHWAMEVDRAERDKWCADIFEQRWNWDDNNWDDNNRARKFWGAGIQYIFADGAIKHSIERYPWMWRVILSEADEVFANGSVIIYRHRGQ